MSLECWCQSLHILCFLFLRSLQMSPLPWKIVSVHAITALSQQSGFTTESWQTTTLLGNVVKLVAQLLGATLLPSTAS